ncbi:MAG: hypothetical protein NTZ10_03505 [Candidatus Saganbacteria bacterium]|nr:hypothetical protein [Candidatus Saganbacteria bacterium]
MRKEKMTTGNLGIYIDINKNGTVDADEKKWMDDYLQNEVKDINDKMKKLNKNLINQLSGNDEDDPTSSVA